MTTESVGKEPKGLRVMLLHSGWELVSCHQLYCNWAQCLCEGAEHLLLWMAKIYQVVVANTERGSFRREIKH